MKQFFKHSVREIVVDIENAGKRVTYDVTFSGSTSTEAPIKIKFEYKYAGDGTLVSKRIREQIKTIANEVHSIGFIIF